MSGVNPVGQPHDFTVPVEKYLGEQWIPAANVNVTPTYSGAGSITNSGPYITDGLRQVTITINSPVAGTATVYDSATISVDGEPNLVSTDGYGAYVVDNPKTWSS